MKKLIVLSVIGLLIAGIAAYQNADVVESKGHVSVKKTQVCHDGDPVEVITVSLNALQAHLDHGDCRIPTCDFANVFHTEEGCTITNPGANCVVANRDNACGVTPGCPVSPDCF